MTYFHHLGKTLLIFFLCYYSFGFSQKKEILEVMKNQEIAWNSGDIPRFMNGYWKNEKMMFIGKNGPTYGWQKTLDNYKKTYPNTVKMGTLTFSDVEITMLGKKHALVFGRWKLQRSSDELKGIYTLVFKKFKKDWKIISDHTE